MQRERSTKAERIRSVLSPTPMSPPGAGSTRLQGGQTQDPYAKEGLRGGEYRRINGAQLAKPHAALRRQQQEEQARHVDLALRSIDEAAQSTPNLARTLVRTQSQAQRERERRLQAEQASEARRAEIDQMSAELARVEMEIQRLGGYTTVVR